MRQIVARHSGSHTVSIAWSSSQFAFVSGGVAVVNGETVNNILGTGLGN